MPVDPTPGQAAQERRRKRLAKQQAKPVKSPGVPFPGTLQVVVPKKGPPRVVTTPGPKPTVESAVESQRPEVKVTVNKARRETLRRQRLLVALDYKVVVDGIWGPRSQKAWNDYTQRQKKGQTLRFGAGPLKKERAKKPLAVARKDGDAQPVIDESDPIIPYFAKVDRAEVEAERQRKQARQEILDRAELLRKTVGTGADKAYRKLTLHQVASVLLDSEAKLAIHTNVGAKVFQEWARANNVAPNLEVTGRYDKQTHDSLVRLLNAQEVRDTKARARAISTRLYGPAGVRPGQKVSWLPYGGVVPTVKEMDEIIQGRGGFQASVLIQAFLRRAQSGEALFDGWRRAELLKTAAKIQPFGVGGQPEWLRGFGSNDGNMLQVYMELLGQAHILAPIEEGSMLPGEKSQEEAYARAMRSEKFQKENARRIANLHAEVKALATASSPEDFTAKLEFQVRLATMKYENMQKTLAGSDGSWWGEAIDATLSIGKWGRTALVYDAMRATQLVMRPYTDDSGPAVQWEDAMAVLGDAPDEYDGFAGKASAWLRVPFELAVDPLNVAHPFRAAATGMRFANIGSKTLGRYSLRGQGLGKALVYERGTWSKLDQLKKIDTVLTGGAIHLDPTVVKWAGRATAMKADVLAQTAGRVRLYAQNGFRAPKPPTVGAKGLYDDFDVRAPKKAKTVKMLEKGEMEVREWLTTDEHHRLDLDTLSAEDQSLFANFDKTRGLSNVGAAYRANRIEKLRILTIHKVASSEAYRIWNEAIAEGVILGEKEMEALAERAYKGYTDVVTGSGTFLKGGFGSSGGSADKEVLVRIEQQLNRHITELDDSIIPTMQSLLEEAAEKRGKAMWDDQGLWAARAGEGAETVRRLGRESFEKGEKKVGNPQFGQRFTREEAHELMEAEIRRRSGRAMQFKTRQYAADMVSDFDPDLEAAGIRADVEKAWDKDKTGYFDSRETLMVSDLYVRHLFNAYSPNWDAEKGMVYRGRRKEKVGSGTYLDHLKALADAPSNVIDSDADDAGWMLAWNMTGGFSKGLPGRTEIHETRRHFGPDTIGVSDEEGRDIVDAARKNSDALKGALSTHGRGVERAYNELLSGELRKEMALWQALAHSQAWHAKTIYFALNGTLQTWKFATLALRPGWMVRNVIDNLAKLMVQGVWNPKYYFLGAKNPGAGIASLFDFGIRDVRSTIGFLDGLFGTNGLEQWMKLEDSIWTHGADTLKRIFAAQGLGETPESLIDAAKFRPFQDESLLINQLGIKGNIHMSADRIAKAVAGWRDGVWDLMGNRPENYWKRVIYRSKYDDARKRLLRDGGAQDDVALDMAAHTEAWEAVEETLFDYSKITAMEDNFQAFFPFIQFWRKNSTFWGKSFVSKPWLPLSVVKVDDERREQHMDLPPWARRYLEAEEITDAAAMIPGLDDALRLLIPDDTQYDPFNLMSFAPFYRSLPKILDELGAQVGMEKGLSDRLKTTNPNLPGEKPGMKIIGPFLDALADYGLGMSPFARKPAEAVGIATERSWQRMFPQTGLAVALTREYFGDRGAELVGGWESAWGHLPFGASNDAIAEHFEYFVQQEMANQALRGDPLDHDQAEKTIRFWFLTQEVFAYGTGMYLRRFTPEDKHLSKIADDGYENLNDREVDALNLWKRRGYDRLSFERYVQLVPLLKAYYATGDDYQAKMDLLSEHPELIKHVNATWRGKPYSGKWKVNAQRFTQQSRFFQALDVTKAIDAPFDVQQAALDAFKTPGMEQHWKDDETPAQERRTLVRAAAFEYNAELTAGYFEIPGNDFEGRSGYLKQHPELVRHWNANNNPTDDYEAIIGGANSALREIYYGIVKEHTVPGKWGEAAGFKAAAPFLREFSFIFEDTKSAGKVTALGEWKKKAGKGKWSKAQTADYVKSKSFLDTFFKQLVPRIGFEAAWKWLEDNADTELSKAVRSYFDKWGDESKSKSDFSPERIAAFKEIKPFMTWFFDVYVKKVGEKKAWAWLEESDSPQAEAMQDYLKKYGKKTKKGVAYLRAKPWLKLYHDMDKESRNAWLDGKSEGAKIVQDYFDRYSGPHGNTQHSEDWLASKKQRELYFSLPKEQRKAWLNGGSADAKVVLDYFKKYSRTNRLEKKFLKNFPKLAGGTPEQQLRLEFWRQYFELSPDQRPAFVHGSAEKFGVFIYGEFGEQEQHDREQEYLRRAVGVGLNKRQSMHLYVKPLLDFYYKLPSEERELFARLNPELEAYLAKYADGAVTGDKKLDSALEGYFKLPPESISREDWLRTHPEVQEFFNSKSSPAEKAIRSVLDQYFRLPGGPPRDEFALRHPEIAAYFEQRRVERSEKSAILDAFDESDPRLTKYYETADDLLRAAEEMRRKLRMLALRKFTPDALEGRRDRSENTTVWL